jgi:lon-related putative ATP-dependent protease
MEGKKMSYELSPAQLRRTCDLSLITCASSAEIKSLGTIIGQERAMRAMHFGLNIRDAGFNLFVAGLPGTGRTTAVERFLEEIASTKPAPQDWCYVHNFEDSYRPQAIPLPPGKGRELHKDMENLLKAVLQEVRTAFQSEQYAAQQENALQAFEDEKKKQFEQLGQLAKQHGFGLQAAPTGITAIPLDNGAPMTEQAFLALSQEERLRLEQGQETVNEAIEALLRQVRGLELQANEAIANLEQQVVHFVLDHLLVDLVEKYQEHQAVLIFFKAVQNEILENTAWFKTEGAPTDPQSPTAQKTPFETCRVNVLVDNSRRVGAPVVVERNPTFGNLFGRIEQEVFMGTLVTDFTLIRGGSLHRANGGFLVLPAEDVLRDPYTWESLKRSLMNREVTIEEPVEQRVFATKSLRPQPIALDVKVILIGRAEVYQILLAEDEHFRELFKVKADFDTVMDCTGENIREYLHFVSELCQTEGLNHVDRNGLARVIELGARMANHQDKLSTRFGEIADVLREANYYAKQQKSSLITDQHIEMAIEEQFDRSALYEERVQELILSDVVKIAVTGAEVGQVNGLTVTRLGGIAFGQPSRITASVGVGRRGVVNVEREAELSGPIHTKGVLVLSGYLAQQFAQDKPLSLNAHLVFEQSYGGVEGDSASSPELYALLSALANVPLRQDIAVTGSVNQKGEIQAIGGVNEKIEGFFAICQAKGLTGQQGVMIPSSNVANLMLKPAVVEVVQSGQFHIWAVSTIDEGIEILTGISAGRNPDGSFAADGIFGRVDRRLAEMAAEMARFTSHDT